MATPHNGVFRINTTSTPAVSAVGTKGAHGIDATSDTGDAIFAKTLSYSGDPAGSHHTRVAAGATATATGITVAIYAEGGPHVAVIAVSTSGIALGAAKATGPTPPSTSATTGAATASPSRQVAGPASASPQVAGPASRSTPATEMA